MITFSGSINKRGLALEREETCFLWNSTSLFHLLPFLIFFPLSFIIFVFLYPFLYHSLFSIFFSLRFHSFFFRKSSFMSFYLGHYSMSESLRIQMQRGFLKNTLSIAIKNESRQKLWFYDGWCFRFFSKAKAREMRRVIKLISRILSRRNLLSVC